MVLAVVTLDIGAGNYRDESSAKVKQLLEVASAQSLSRAIPEDKRELAINELAAMGDDIIVQLAEIYKSDRYKNNIVIVLKKIGTQKAKETLLNMALGQNGFNETYSTAARQYIELAGEKEELKTLLVSTNSLILSEALLGIKGIKVDADLLQRLDEILQSVQYNPVLNCALRTNAANIIVADTGSELMQEKISAIVKSINTVEKQPKANERYGQTIIGTFADRTYLNLAKALINIKDADKYLSQATSSMTDNPRGWILAIRANRGDSTEKNELRKIMEDPHMLERTLFRSFALSGYARIGTTEDIPFLRNIAENDPVLLIERRDATGPVLEIINGKPINNAGERSVSYDEDEYVKKLWELPRGRYTIRSQAESAIETIEKRIKNN